MTSRFTRTRGTAVAVALAAAVTLGAGGLAAAATSVSTSARPSTVDVAAEGRPPVDPDLVAAREKAAKLQGRERREAHRAIRAAVEGGTYGKEAKARLDRRKQRLEKLRGQVPAALRKDLKTLGSQTQDEQAATRQQIRDRALAGDYGKGAQRLLRAID